MAVAVSVVVAAQSVAMSVSYASDPKPGYHIVYQDEAGTVVIPTKSAGTKQQWSANYGPSAEKATSDVGIMAWLNCSGGTSVGPNSGTLSANGHTWYQIQQNTWDVKAIFTDSEGYFYWGGLNPYNATTINGTLRWWASGLAVTPELPGGAGMSVHGNAIHWDASVSNQYSMGMYRDPAVRISTQGITSVGFMDEAGMLLAGNWYWVQGC